MPGVLSFRGLTPTTPALDDEVMVYDRNDGLVKSCSVSELINSGLTGGGTSDLIQILGAEHRFYIAGTEQSPSKGWKDITSDLATGKVAGANVPTWSAFRSGLYGYAFSASALNEVWISFHINHDYAEGTAIYPHVHFSPTTTSTGVVRWGFEYSIAKGHDQEAFPASTTVYVDYNIATNKQYQHLIAEVSDNDAPLKADLETDSLVLMRVFRDGGNVADTFPDSVIGWTVDIHYQAERMFTLNKSPLFHSGD